MARIKAIQLMLNSKLPEEMRDYSRTPDSKNIGDLMARLAKERPELYEKVSHDVADIGRNASYYQGETLRLSDLKPVFDKDSMLKEMDKELDAMRKASKNPKDYERDRENIWQKYSSLIEKTTKDEALRLGNNLGYSVASGARGNATQLKAMLSTPGLYADNKGRTVPMFIRHSFSQGLRPAEYLAGMYGARTSVISTKIATAKGGDLLKQLVQTATPLTVTKKDCGTTNGIDMPLDDDSLRGRVLVRPAGGLPAGTVLDSKALGHLKKGKIGEVIVRSALTCSQGNGLCSKCLGLQPDGRFHKIGDSVGVTAGQAIGEPITQGSLNTKHTSGAASAKKDFSGFSYLSQFVQAPESFPDKAAVAEEDGTVKSVDEAPQGGFYITIGDRKIYALPGFTPIVKPGDQVEAGDQLSEGLINASDMVRLKGLGEGRRYYAERFNKMMRDSGFPADKRNTEIIARAAIDHVRLENPDEMDGFEDSLPDDVIGYNSFSSRYTPPEDTKLFKAKEAVGSYLQVPALHYTIGTRVTPKMADNLSKKGFNDIYVSKAAPTFFAEMPNLRTASHVQDDWLAQMHTSYLGKNLAESAVRGGDTNVLSNTHFAPRLAVGVGFGEGINETGKF